MRSSAHLTRVALVRCFVIAVHEPIRRAVLAWLVLDERSALANLARLVDLAGITPDQQGAPRPVHQGVGLNHLGRAADGVLPALAVFCFRQRLLDNLRESLFV